MPEEHPRKCDNCRIAYLAGLFDGEGCVASTMQGGLIRIHITVTLTHKPTLEKFETVFGGTIKDRKKYENHHKDRYAWGIFKAEDTLTTLQILYPFLFLKKDQAGIAISYLKHKIKIGKQWHSKEFKDLSQMVHEHLRELKKQT